LFGLAFFSSLFVMGVASAQSGCDKITDFTQKQNCEIEQARAQFGEKYKLPEVEKVPLIKKEISKSDQQGFTEPSKPQVPGIVQQSPQYSQPTSPTTNSGSAQQHWWEQTSNPSQTNTGNSSGSNNGSVVGAGSSTTQTTTTTTSDSNQTTQHRNIYK
jgi:hypothetical protein